MPPTLTKSFFVAVLSIFCLNSCRYDETPVGVYTGTFDCYACPTGSGNGTLVITETSDDIYSMTLAMPGNPDFTREGLTLPRQSSLNGLSFAYESYYPDSNLYLQIDEYGYDASYYGPWNVQLSYHTELPSSFWLTFYGNRQ